ncbi:MAG: CinA family protein [Bacteroidales bacterium]|nr:CinA family protein [Bacteroidales bacterium]
MSQDISLEEEIGRLLRACHATVATAESCTGGYIAHRLTAVAGSSAYFLGGVVSYANEVKSGLLGVPAGLIADVGAVSREVVEAMAAGARRRIGSDYAVATSGIAGPGGGTSEKPVGTVWMAVACPDGRCVSLCHHFGDRPRWDIIRAAAHEALSLLKAQLS